jgi:hypothetical protein
MQQTLNNPSLGSADPETSSNFNVVIAYEDFEAGKHAKRTYDFLVDNLGGDCRLTNEMWKFDVLRVPKLQEMAAKDAALADIILVSGHGGSELPREVKSWLEAWLRQPGQALALVALFDRPREHTLPIRSYLAGIAQRARVAFFAQPDDWPQAGQGGLLPAFQRHPGLKEGTLFTTLAGVVQRENLFPRWEMFE